MAEVDPVTEVIRQGVVAYSKADDLELLYLEVAQDITRRLRAVNMLSIPMGAFELHEHLLHIHGYSEANLHDDIVKSDTTESVFHDADHQNANWDHTH